MSPEALNSPGTISKSKDSHEEGNYDFKNQCIIHLSKDILSHTQHECFPNMIPYQYA